MTLRNSTHTSDKGRCTAFLAAICLFGILTTARSQPIIDDEKFFHFTACNRSKAQIQIAILHRDPYVEDKWVLQSWYNAPANQCTAIGRFPRGYFYLFAQQTNSQIIWSGTNRYICVSSRQTERVVFANERCLVGEANRGFTETFTKDATYTYSFVMN